MPRTSININTCKKEQIFVKTKTINYSISLSNKITYLFDDSGTGKTSLFNNLKSYILTVVTFNGELASYSVYNIDSKGESTELLGTYSEKDFNKIELEKNNTIIFAERPLFPITEVDLVKYDSEGYSVLLEEYNNSILYCDEDIIIAVQFSRFLEACIISEKNIKVLVAGRLICSCPYLDLESIYRLKYNAEQNSNVNVPVYSASKAPDDVNIVLIGDSKSGFNFYKNYFSRYNIPVISCHGKNNIIRILSCLDYSKHFPYIICDGYSFGKEFFNLKSNLNFIDKCFNKKTSEEETNRLFAYRCLEQLVLESDWIVECLAKLPENKFKKLEEEIYLRSKDSIPEEAAAIALSSILRVGCGRYSKQITSKNCILKDCLSNVMDCKNCTCLDKTGVCTCYFKFDVKSENILKRFKDILPNKKPRILAYVTSVQLKDNKMGVLVDNKLTLFDKSNITFVLKDVKTIIKNLDKITLEDLIKDKESYVEVFRWSVYDRFNDKLKIIGQTKPNLLSNDMKKIKQNLDKSNLVSKKLDLFGYEN